MTYPTLVPHLIVNDGPKAMEFYKAAFGAEEVARNLTPDSGRLFHGELRIADSVLLLCDEFPEMDPSSRSPQSLGATSMTLDLMVEDADAACAKAVAAGATVTMPEQDTFWGARYGKITDPFGHHWAFNQQVRQVSAEELAKGAVDPCV